VKKPDWAGLGIREAAAAIAAHLRSRGIDAALVGGACVSIYSSNAYESFDLDFVSFESQKRIGPAMAEIGFIKTPGRHFDHPQCRYYAEFVSPPVAIGGEIVKKLKKLRTPLGLLQLLSPTDCVKDRLAAYIHWRDFQALEQAVMVGTRHRIQLAAIRAWAEKEDGAKQFGEFRSVLAARKRGQKLNRLLGNRP
jgi:hypothetical protein